ncbi:hypothetical protein RvY_01353-2 [Ramazzottius varieornatus]|uniref:GPI ethanolamine phosphate transferase 2 C-terminal domain-containing protein n=1 Tax=Ramazzottius varieornatus TaxID=947166 RepID=A0A1D1UM43_RAMVA|nr:hypothetical protein RvY_01353-2 [Ramazzottius varieornatus]
MMFVLHRVLREWNRTGDKWAHLPDVGDWIRQPEQSIVLTASLLVCCIIQVWLRVPDVMMVFGLVCGTLYHVSTNDYFAWFAYFFMLTKIAGLRPKFGPDEWTCLRDAFNLLTLIISRSYNIPALTLVQLLEYQLRKVSRRSKLPLLSIIFLYYLHASSTFFLLGNSNAISSIDVSAGFAAVPFYFAPLHGFLILAHTYAGPIFWMASLAQVVGSMLDNRSLLLTVTMLLLIDGVFLLITLTNVTLQRRHLFIWTVFAPKVLYKCVGSWLVSFSVMVALKTTLI